MNKLLCIYHGGCDDGFGAAYVVRWALGNDAVEFYPGVYGRTPPDVAGRDVLMVDFSYKRPVIEEMRRSARSILILDHHHKTAAEDLSDYPGMDLATPGYWQRWQRFVRNVEEDRNKGIRCPVAVVFDMTRSGTGIAWDFFMPNTQRKKFVNYIEDRDLWRKELVDGDEFTIALRSYPQTFESWDKLMGAGVERLIEEGHGIQRYYRLQVEALKEQARPGRIGFTSGGEITLHLGAFVNAPYAFASEVADEISDITFDGIRHVEFGACYFRRADGRWQYSLRCDKNHDVSEIARVFGGGGHAQSAGFDSAEPVHADVED